MRGVRLRNVQSEAAGAAGPAEPGAGGAARVRPAARWRSGWIVAVIPALAELLVGGYRIGVPSLWRDEAATISGSRRSLAAIATMMRHEDAVHAPYYVLMHPVVAVGGASATVLRLPSLIAMTLAVGLTAALGRRLALDSGLPGANAVGLLAGLALTAVPLTTRYAQEARPYALATLFAVAATYAFVVALASPRRRWWGALRVGLAADRSVQPVRGADRGRARGKPALAPQGEERRRGRGGSERCRARSGPLAGVTPVVFRRWLAACVAAAILLSPLIVLSAGQSSQLNWVRRPGLGTLAALARDFAGTTVLIPVVALLALFGCAAGIGVGGGARRPDVTAVGPTPVALTPIAVTPIALTPIALPWLVAAARPADRGLVRAPVLRRALRAVLPAGPGRAGRDRAGVAGRPDQARAGGPRPARSRGRPARRAAVGRARADHRRRAGRTAARDQAGQRPPRRPARRRGRGGRGTSDPATPSCTCRAIPRSSASPILPRSGTCATSGSAGPPSRREHCAGSRLRRASWRAGWRRRGECGQSSGRTRSRSRRSRRPR